MSLVVRAEDLPPSATPYGAMEFYPPPRSYEPMLDASSMPIIPIAAAANPGKLLQPVVRTVGKHGGLSLLSRTPEEIALDNSIRQMLPHLNEKYQARVRKMYFNATHFIKGKKEGQDKPVSMKNLIKVSQFARQLLARQIKVQAGGAEREARKAKNSVVSHKTGAYNKDGTKILSKGAAQKAFGKAKRARMKNVTAELLRGENVEQVQLGLRADLCQPHQLLARQHAVAHQVLAERIPRLAAAVARRDDLAVAEEEDGRLLVDGDRQHAGLLLDSDELQDLFESK